MALLGLTERHSLCKICNVFSEDLLNEITLDVLLHRRTYDEIKEHFDPLLPEGVKKLSHMNINNHRKHSDPALLADEVLRRNREPVTEEEIITFLYQERFKKELDKHQILKESYRERLNNLFVLQQELENVKKELEDVRVCDPEYYKMSAEDKQEHDDDIKRLRGSIRIRTIEIDGILSSIQQVLIKEVNSDKGIGEGSQQIIIFQQNFIGDFRGRMKQFMNLLIPYLLHDVFIADPVKGQEVIKRIAQMMDLSIGPALEEPKQIQEVTHVSVPG